MTAWLDHSHVTPSRSPLGSRLSSSRHDLSPPRLDLDDMGAQTTSQSSTPTFLRTSTLSRTPTKGPRQGASDPKHCSPAGSSVSKNRMMAEEETSMPQLPQREDDGSAVVVESSHSPRRSLSSNDDDVGEQGRRAPIRIAPTRNDLAAYQKYHAHRCSRDLIHLKHSSEACSTCI